MTRLAAALALVAARALADPAEDALKELKQAWPSLDAAGRAKGVEALEPYRTPAILAQCKVWIGDKEPAVRAAVVRIVAVYCSDTKLRPPAIGILVAYLDGLLDLRQRREAEEFAAVLKEFGRKIPPDNQMAAGADWEDPYDPKRRPLPPEIVAERAHLRAILAALLEVRAKELRPALMRLFREHHDPEVLASAIACLAAWRMWEALPEIADLARVQSQGRAVGGGDVIGREKYETMRLKWDVHKDRLWWSRPEYLPRLSRALVEAGGAIAGTTLESVRELDAWLLSHEAELAAHGVKLTAEFRARARSTQG